jgi:hypothetical protein
MSRQPNGSTTQEKRAVRAANQADPLWTVEDCAIYLRVSETKLRQLVDAGRVPHLWLDPERRYGLRFVPAIVSGWAVEQSRGNGGDHS